MASKYHNLQTAVEELDGAVIANKHKLKAIAGFLYRQQGVELNKEKDWHEVTRALKPHFDRQWHEPGVCKLSNNVKPLVDKVSAALEDFDGSKTEIDQRYTKSHQADLAHDASDAIQEAEAEMGDWSDTVEIITMGPCEYCGKALWCQECFDHICPTMQEQAQAAHWEFVGTRDGHIPAWKKKWARKEHHLNKARQHLRGPSTLVYPLLYLIYAIYSFLSFLAILESVFLRWEMPWKWWGAGLRDHQGLTHMDDRRITTWVKNLPQRFRAWLFRLHEKAL